MSTTRSILLVLAVLLPVFTGCTLKNVVSPIEIDQDLVLEDTPFYPQMQYQCGPASLAMLLNASGIMTSPEALAPHTYLPGRQGSLQLELLAASRLHNRIPYVLPPDFSALIAELRSGRPVLVLQNLGLNILPAYHYAVVIGVLKNGHVILHSGDKRRMVMDLDRFLLNWQRSGSWGMIVLQPGELPAVADPVHYIEAVSAFEQSGHLLGAQKSYLAAHSTWPAHETTLFALGNNYLSLGRYREAEAVFRELIQRNPGQVAAANNLAEALVLRRCYAEAYEVITQAVLLADKLNSPHKKTLRQTQQEITRHLHSAGHLEKGTCGTQIPRVPPQLK